MVAETGESTDQAGTNDTGTIRGERDPRVRRRLVRRFFHRFTRFLGFGVLSSLTRRIVVLNLAGLIALVSAVLYLNQFRAGLIDARVQSLMVQGEIIAGAIAAQATVERDAITIDPERLLELRAGQSLSPMENSLSALDFPINPEKVAPILRRLISPTRTRARIYDHDGVLVLDSRHLYSRGQILTFDLPPPAGTETNWFAERWRAIKLWFRRTDLPLYRELAGGNGKGYPEVENALSGSSASVVRVNERGEMIVSVAVPVQRFRAVLGALMLSTQGGDIDAIVSAERMAILRVFLVAAVVMVVLSILMASTIAGPVRRLSAGAERVRHSIKARAMLPDFGDRGDEIGHLARALHAMTNALYSRMDAIESFAADVSHELKNPLTSLKSAVETLPLARTSESRERLIAVIQHDIRRLDRLITDISDASRLDAELAREDAATVDLEKVLAAVVAIQRDIAGEGGPNIHLEIRRPRPSVDEPFMVFGHDSRLGQVFTNIIDNARSFSAPGTAITITLSMDEETAAAIITVDDEGPGIRPDMLEHIFARFYTDRPESEGFGNNSGLGLSISRQIVEAHGGTIKASNRVKAAKTKTGKGQDGAGHAQEQPVLGARFTIQLPLEQPR